MFSFNLYMDVESAVETSSEQSELNAPQVTLFVLFIILIFVFNFVVYVSIGFI